MVGSSYKPRSYASSKRGFDDESESVVAFARQQLRRWEHYYKGRTEIAGSGFGGFELEGSATASSGAVRAFGQNHLLSFSSADVLPVR